MELHQINGRSPENLYRRQEAAFALKITTSALDNLIATGHISTVNIHGRVRITPSALLQYIQRQSRGSSLPENIQLKMVRESAFLSPEELAALCGYEPEVVTAAESGVQLPRQVFAELVATAVFTIITGKQKLAQEAVAV